MGHQIDALDEEILRVVEREGKVTPSRLASLIRSSRVTAWRRLRKLEAAGLLTSKRMGGVVIFEPATPPRPGGVFRLALLRASEYPYITRLLRRLRERYREVVVDVYDEAFRLATDLARGKLHAAMIPAVTALLVHRASGGAVVIAGGGSSGGAGVVEGSGGDGHATTMASTMELCAVSERLPGPRVYARSAEEILGLVAEGKVRFGVVWEPYLSRAEEEGFRVHRCYVPVCCLLAVHRSLEDSVTWISRAMADSVSEARRGMADLDVYSRILSLDLSLVKKTVDSYELIEEPPVEDIRRMWSYFVEAALPPDTLTRAVVVGRR